MRVAIEPRKATDRGGYYCMPLKVNVPTGRKDCGTGKERYRMDNENKCCGTCYWHKKCCGEFQCFNESAEGFAIETAYDDGKDCEEWEER